MTVHIRHYGFEICQNWIESMSETCWQCFDMKICNIWYQNLELWPGFEFRVTHFEQKFAILEPNSAIMNLKIGQFTCFQLHFDIIHHLKSIEAPFPKSFLRHRPITPIFESKFNKLSWKSDFWLPLWQTLKNCFKNA